MSYDEIARCALRYVIARGEANGNDEVGAAEAVLRARVALAECLLQSGWTPDKQTEAALMRDLQVLDQPVGSFENHPELHKQTG